MKQRVSKTIAGLLCIAMGSIAFFATACGEQPVTPKPPVERVWTPETIRSKPVTTNDLFIGSYVTMARPGIMTTPEQIERIADGGMNFVPLASCMSDYGMTYEGEAVRRDMSDLTWWKSIDELMKDYNLGYFFSTKTGIGNDSETSRHNYDPASEEALAAAAKIVPELDNCIGYLLKDEPSYSEFDALASYAKRYAAIKPDVYAVVNHFPFPVGYGTDYYGFIKAWVDKAGAGNIRYASHDYYPFMAGDTNYNILKAMDDMRRVAVDTGVSLSCFPQSCSWNGTRMPNADEIIWELNAYIAHGYSMFMYFNYTMYPQEGCDDAIFDRDGNFLHREIYDALAEHHLRLRAMAANISFTSMQSVGVYYTDAAFANRYSLARMNNELAISNEGLSKANLLIGVLADGEDSCLWIQNNSMTSEIASQTFVLNDSVTGCTGVEVYNFDSGKFESAPVEDGTFTLSFGKSEAHLVRLV